MLNSFITFSLDARYVSGLNDILLLVIINTKGTKHIITESFIHSATAKIKSGSKKTIQISFLLLCEHKILQMVMFGGES